jgi:ABC-type Zn uptake system ZnuABC Zn-binding protein ZnuA
VLATFLPTWVFARNVIGDAPGVSLDILLPASLGCPHDYALTPGDMRKLASADLLVANGAGMEEFLGLPVRKANPKLRVVETAAAVPLLPYGGGEEGHRHGEGNPHAWVSARNAAAMVHAVEKALSAASPGNAPLFRRNADAYAARLAALAGEMEKSASRFRKRRIVTAHATFDYLARDLGLEVVGVIGAEPGREPSAGEVARLVGKMRKEGAAAVFSEPQYPARMAATVAREAGVPVRELDPAATGPLSAGAFEAAMRKNLAVLAEVLSR